MERGNATREETPKETRGSANRLLRIHPTTLPPSLIGPPGRDADLLALQAAVRVEQDAVGGAVAAHLLLLPRDDDRRLRRLLEAAGGRAAARVTRHRPLGGGGGSHVVGWY